MFDIIFCKGKYDRIMIKKIYVYKKRGNNESPVLYVKCIKYMYTTLAEPTQYRIAVKDT